MNLAEGGCRFAKPGVYLLFVGDIRRNAGASYALFTQHVESPRQSIRISATEGDGRSFFPESPRQSQPEPLRST
jgi:hypothetical protein